MRCAPRPVSCPRLPPANVDTDVMVSEEPELGSTRKPEELYEIIERFCNGRCDRHQAHDRSARACPPLAPPLPRHAAARTPRHAAELSAVKQRTPLRILQAPAGAVWRGPQHPRGLGHCRQVPYLEQLQRAGEAKRSSGYERPGWPPRSHGRKRLGLGSGHCSGRGQPEHSRPHPPGPPHRPPRASLSRACRRTPTTSATATAACGCRTSWAPSRRRAAWCWCPAPRRSRSCGQSRRRGTGTTGEAERGSGGSGLLVPAAKAFLVSRPVCATAVERVGTVRGTAGLSWARHRSCAGSQLLRGGTTVPRAVLPCRARGVERHGCTLWRCKGRFHAQGILVCISSVCLSPSSSLTENRARLQSTRRAEAKAVASL